MPNALGHRPRLWLPNRIAGRLSFSAIRRGLGHRRHSGTGAPSSTIQVLDQFHAQDDFNGGELGIAIERRLCRWSLESNLKLALGNTHSHIDINGSTTTAAGVSSGGLLALPSNMGVHNADQFSVIPELGMNVQQSNVSPSGDVGLHVHLLEQRIAAHRARRHRPIEAVRRSSSSRIQPDAPPAISRRRPSSAGTPTRAACCEDRAHLRFKHFGIVACGKRNLRIADARLGQRIERKARVHGLTLRKSP